MQRVYVIYGCTASGKSKLAAELARRHGGRIISVDSMKIYRGMDIGTAKPSAETRREIEHYCIDVAEPWQGESFTVADFMAAADAGIAACAAAGVPAIVAGGTGLYLKSVLEGLFDGPGESPELREQLNARAEADGLIALHAELAEVDPEAAGRIHPNDRRRIVRALEVYRLTGRPISEHQRQWDAGRRRYDVRMVALRWPREQGNRRINQRVKRMVEAGLVDEVRRLWQDPRGLNEQAAAAVGYAEIIRHFRGECTLEEAIEQIKIDTRHLAKNQRTWLRHFREAQMLDLAAEDTVEAVADRADPLLELA